jgi:hypothetical protein
MLPEKKKGIIRRRLAVCELTQIFISFTSKYIRLFLWLPLLLLLHVMNADASCENSTATSAAACRRLFDADVCRLRAAITSKNVSKRDGNEKHAQTAMLSAPRYRCLTMQTAATPAPMSTSAVSGKTIANIAPSDNATQDIYI